MPACSLGLSEATPPDPVRDDNRTPEGCQPAHRETPRPARPRGRPCWYPSGLLYPPHPPAARRPPPAARRSLPAPRSPLSHASLHEPASSQPDVTDAGVAKDAKGRTSIRSSIR
jgi:hypothetical protein